MREQCALSAPGLRPAAGSPVGSRDPTAAEREQILEGWSRPSATWPEGPLVPDLVVSQAARAPGALAASDPAGELTYGELDRRARHLAMRLRQLGVGPEERVAVCMPSSRELLVSYLGILRAGGAYVPIDPAQPDARLRYLLEDSRARALVVSSATASRLRGASEALVVADMGETLRDGEGGACRASEEAPDAGTGPRNAAYVIYTSGSTGAPKGVVVEHRSLSNLVAAYRRRLGIGEADRAAMIAGMAFDAAVADIWPYLAAGASVHVPPPAARTDPRALVRWLLEAEIDLAFLPTALGQVAFAQPWPPATRLRTVLVGGEKLPAPPAQRMPFSLVNTYGPTECTVDATWHIVETGVGGAAPPPIGRPIENYRAYVVDENGSRLGAGELGELWIGGVGVARGYLNRPELTAERFLADPWGDDPGERVYRTGDRVSVRADGAIEYHGRIDDQVQIRGFRVEPGEIEAVFAAHPEVDAVAVVAHEDGPGGVRLAAYVVPKSGEPDLVLQLRQHARERLSSYMVPRVVLLERLPLTPNGKVDRRALLSLEEPGSDRVAGEVAAPRDEIERKLVEIWKEQLGVAAVGIDESFFDLGGDSLSLVSMVAAAECALGVELDVAELAREPTIAVLASLIRGEPARVSLVVPLREGGERAPFFCVAGAGGGCHWFGDLARGLRSDRAFLGLEPAPSPEAGEHSIEAIAAALLREVRRIQEHGPYFLGGYSTGGIVAFELAQRLRQAGEEVALLALIEADGARPYAGRLGQARTYLTNLVRRGPGEAARILLDRASFALRAMRERLRRAPEVDVVSERMEARKERDERAMRAYEPRAYGGDVWVFACEDRPMTAIADDTCGWGEIVLGQLVSERVPGNHYTMLAPPNVKTLARALQGAIDHADRSIPVEDPARPLHGNR